MSKRYKGLKTKQNGDFRVAQWRLTNQRLTRGTAVAAYEVPEAVSTRRIKQSAKGISVNPEKYVRDLLKKYDINGSSVKTPMQANLTFNSQLASVQDIKQNPKESHLIDVKRIFRCNMDKKSNLAEYEYVTAARCCENILWMKSQLSDYDSVFRKRKKFVTDKDALKATSGQTSLGVTGEVRADPQLSCVVSASSTEPLYSASTHMHSESASGHDALADLTAKADLEKSDPKDSLLPRQGTVQTELEIENELTAENFFVTDTKEVGESSDDDEIKWD
ncbi:hypothetical protein Tco_0126826, partial [Tanacetum coccineum]